MSGELTKGRRQSWGRGGRHIADCEKQQTRSPDPCDPRPRDVYNIMPEGRGGEGEGGGGGGPAETPANPGGYYKGLINPFINDAARRIPGQVICSSACTDNGSPAMSSGTWGPNLDFLYKMRLKPFFPSTEIKCNLPPDPRRRAVYTPSP